MHPDLIAPCGMNCRLCRAYGREKNPCMGCRDSGDPAFQYLTSCRIRNCELVVTGQVRYCFECGRYPCKALKRLDKRYRTNYGMSMMDNLEMMEEIGLEGFAQREKERWTCPQCGEILCVHKGACVSCGRAWR